MLNKINKMLLHLKTRNQISMRAFFPQISLVLLVAFLNLVIGCSYYKVTTTPTDATAIQQMQKNGKYIILHQGNDVWHLKNITINEGKKEMAGIIELLSHDHHAYLHTKPNATNRYNSSKDYPIYEVHIYASKNVADENSQIKIPLAAISKIEIYDQAVGATIASFVFTSIGIVAGVFVIAMVILFLTKSSCPFVYISNGSSYHFAGEMYGGAIYSSLERDDFMPVDFTSPNGPMTLK
jgi:hypothetical protein